MDAAPRSRREQDRPQRRPDASRALAGVELLTGTTALAGGALLAVRPDGSLLGVTTAALAGTPFSDWRVPGALLGSLVGGGGIVAGSSVLARSRYARPISALFGAGLFAFEVVEAGWIGFHPLQAVVGALGVGIAALVLGAPQSVRAGRAR